jgi:glycosyltransferase involved in cell wall biosynthesis
LKKILIITYYWPPAGGPGVQRWLKFAKYLQELGVQPIVLTVNPKKATYPLRDESLVDEVSSEIQVYTTATFEPFSAYKKATGRGEVPFSGFANESDKPGPRQIIAKFIRGNFFLPDARRGWNKYALAKAEYLIKKFSINTIITTSPPHSSQLIGLRLKQKYGVKWLADFRDPWTDIYYYNELYPTFIAKYFDKKMERSVLLNASYITTVSEDMKRLLGAKDEKIRASKIAVLPNGFDHSDFTDWESPSNDSFTIVYGGTLTHKYSVQTFLSVLDNLAEKGLKLKLVFAGNQDEIVQNQLAALKFLTIEKLGYVSHAVALENLKNADALFLAIPDLPENKGILTGKLFEYLAAKRSIINIGPVDGDAAKTIALANAGVTCDYKDVVAIERAITECYEMWQAKKTREFNDAYIAKFSRKALTDQLAALIS